MHKFDGMQMYYQRSFDTGSLQKWEIAHNRFVRMSSPSWWMPPAYSRYLCGLEEVISPSSKSITKDLLSYYYVHCLLFLLPAVYVILSFRLVLSNCHWVSRRSMKYMAQKQPPLITLNLTGCWELCDETLIEIVESIRT